jgi:anti-sigma regulatory factor (Ser/Thr protein kinase)
MVYRGEEAQIRELRRWLSGQLPECAARDDLITIAAELATNAVKHTASGRGGWFTVEVSWLCAAVRVAIADQGAPSGPQLTGDPDPLAESGRGLQVVRGLSARAGVAGDRDGRVVWAEVPWTGETPRLPRPGDAPELPRAGDVLEMPRAGDGLDVTRQPAPQGAGPGRPADGIQVRRRSAAQRVS